MKSYNEPEAFVIKDEEYEVWESIKNYDYNYEISNLGNFRCMNPFHKNKTGLNYKQNIDSKGYPRVGLVLNGKVKTIKTHRLVAMYFLKNFKENLTVNHKDLVKTNNKVSNLEMLTTTDNILHYQKEVISKKSSSKQIGVFFHSGINKWVARVTFNNKRYNLGVFDLENKAINAIINFNNNSSLLKIGKGKSNLGKSKYTNENNEEAVKLSYKIGIRKAGVETGMGSTKISILRKQLCNTKN
jgi:hypothetical protein